MNFQLAEIRWLAVKVLLVYAAHLQYGTLWQGEVGLVSTWLLRGSWVMLFYGCLWIFCSKLSLDSQTDTFFWCGNYSLYRQYYRLRTWLLYPSLPSSRKKPCSKLSANCKRVVCWLRGGWDWMQNCEGMMGVSYPALLVLFSMSILPSLLPNVPSCTDMPVPWPTQLLRFTIFMEWTTQIFWTFDVVMLATQSKRMTWADMTAWPELSKHIES